MSEVNEWMSAEEDILSALEVIRHWPFDKVDLQNGKMEKSLPNTTLILARKIIKHIHIHDTQ